MGAYACEPSQGSEPAVGWHWAQEAVRAGHEVWVVTRSNNQASIKGSVPADVAARLHFHYLDLPKPLLWLKRKLGHPGLLAYYYVWQVSLSVVARRLHKRVGFDLAHHVTFVNDWLPSGLCVLPVPFIWGPVGGSTHSLPRSIELDLPTYARRHELIRSFLQRFLRRVDPFLALTRHRAQLILVYTHEALGGLKDSERSRARAVVHIGISEEEPPHRAFHQNHDAGSKRLRILTGGRLVHWKGFDLVIEGFARFVRSEDVESLLTVTGAGPYESRLRDLATREGVAEMVDFVGRLPRREDVFAVMEGCDVFALPTLRDGPPVSLLEAMAFGLPVLCLDLGATAELVPDRAGFKIAPRSRAHVVHEIGRAFAWVRSHPAEAAEMGMAARCYVLEHHHWRRIRETIGDAYTAVAQ
jgi:glycosyltransferase involved in cell wall biosynthesis